MNKTQIKSFVDALIGDVEISQGAQEACQKRASQAKAPGSGDDPTARDRGHVTRHRTASLRADDDTERRQRNTDLSDVQLSKTFAIDQFLRRKNYASKQEKYDNCNLPSGSPVYVYCEHCGILLERLPEDYLFSPLEECSQCVGLKKHGWLKDAIAGKVARA